MRNTKLLIPDQVSEHVSVVSIPRHEERSNISYLDFITMKRYNEEVNFSRCQTPVKYADSVLCYQDSTRKRFKSQTFYMPKVKPRKFRDTLIVFAKHPRKSYVTYVDYKIDECKKWFKTSLEFKARTYTTKRIIGEEVEEVEDKNTKKDIDEPTGPGASQVYLPRWHRDTPDYNQNIHIRPSVLDGELLINGY